MIAMHLTSTDWSDAHDPKRLRGGGGDLEFRVGPADELLCYIAASLVDNTYVDTLFCKGQ